MKIVVLCILFGFYTCASGIFWPTAKKPKIVPRDCGWTKWSPWKACVEEYAGSATSTKSRARKQIPAKHGGKPCTETNAVETKPCTATEYSAGTFIRTLHATTKAGAGKAGKGGGSQTARRTINVNNAAKPPVATKSCTPAKDIKDEAGNVVVFGRKCPNTTRAKRELSSSYAAVRRRSKRQVLSTKNRDVLFLIDESGSVGLENYKKILRMVRAVANSFCGAISIGSTTTRVGLASFNRDQFPQINFDKYFEKAVLLSKLTSPNIKYHGYPSAGATCLVDALKFTRSKMLTPARGARMNVAGTERLVVLMTDGCANCIWPRTKLNATLSQVAKQFSNEGIPIINFLITKATTHCFDLMKGLSDGSHCYQQYWAATWEKLDEMSGIIESHPCMDAWQIGPSC